MKFWGGIGLTAGVLMILSAIAHALGGWPSLQPSLVSAGVDPDVIAALRIGWVWGSAAMLCFGIIVIGQAWNALHGRSAGALTVSAIAGAYLVFGTWAFVSRGFNPHFMLFIVTGLLVAALIPACRAPAERVPRG